MLSHGKPAHSNRSGKNLKERGNYQGMSVDGKISQHPDLESFRDDHREDPPPPPGPIVHKRQQSRHGRAVDLRGQSDRLSHKCYDGEYLDNDVGHRYNSTPTVLTIPKG